MFRAIIFLFKVNFGRTYTDSHEHVLSTFRNLPEIFLEMAQLSRFMSAVSRDLDMVSLLATVRKPSAK